MYVCPLRNQSETPAALTLDRPGLMARGWGCQRGGEGHEGGNCESLSVWLFCSHHGQVGLHGDTISIPLEKSAQKVVNNMHVNYASASCTTVHDKYLLQFDWREHGTPCLALVFSPWFTRG